MSDANQTIEFVEACAPPITPGAYTLTVTQEIEELDADSKVVPGGIRASYASAAKTVHVQGERFSIDPRDIHAVYPPDGGVGDYGHERALPHITFSRKSLPWDQAGSLAASGMQQPVPWLALLVFHESDEGGLPAIVPAMVGDLSRENFLPGAALAERPSTLAATARQGTASYADLLRPKTWSRRPGENAWDACQVVDIPIRLFARIAPTQAELPWLVHAHIASGATPRLSRSTVVANRLPLREGSSLACLVSLADIAHALPPAPITLADGQAATHVRLVVLKAWAFRCGAALQGFNQALSTGPLKVPYQAPGAETPEDLGVKQALAMGYTALDHHTRWGDQAVSWYRGPFLPFSSKISDQLPRPPICAEGYETGSKPISCADEALRYDPELGMQDVSYAAAWQLGRLIALRDETFARDLYHWKRENKQRILAPQAAEVFAFLAELMQAAVGWLNPAQAARELLNDPGRLKAHLSGARAPESVVSRLARLRRLEGVPLDYLVPDERMLPPESLRFFQLDQNWVYSLVEGAYSIARVSSDDQKQDAATCPHEVYRQVSGFLLRSKIVSGWPQLEAQVEVSNRASTVRTLRCQRITPDILLYLVEVDGPGVITSVTLQVPAESLEFQLPKGAAFRDFTQSVIDIQALAQGQGSAAHFALKLAGVCIPTLAYDRDRDGLTANFDSPIDDGHFEWQYLIDERPFGPAVAAHIPAVVSHRVEMQIPLADDLPAGRIAVRVRAAAHWPRISPGRWMTSAVLNRAPAPGAQPSLHYRVGDSWVTAEWPAAGDRPRLEVQFWQPPAPGLHEPLRKLGAIVPVEPAQASEPGRAQLTFGFDSGGHVARGKVQVRFRQPAPAGEQSMPGAWAISTASLLRLYQPMLAGGSTTFVSGVLTWLIYDTPANVPITGGSTIELRLTPSVDLHDKRGPRARKLAGPAYVKRGTGQSVTFIVTPADLAPGRYVLSAQVIGVDNQLISSTLAHHYSDAEPLRLLGKPIVTANAAGLLSWNSIDAAVYYVVSFNNTGNGRQDSAIVQAAAGTSLDIASQHLPEGSYDVYVQAYGSANSIWTGPVSEPVLVTVRQA